MPKKIYIRTFGCQMNSRDSEFIAGRFLERGYKLADSAEAADVVLFNTCSVRAHAEERAISNIGHLMHADKRKIYGIVGCVAQALGGKLFKRLPGLNIVCGTGEIGRLPDLVKKAKNNRVLALNNKDALLPESKSTYRKSNAHAYVSIMQGCNNFCSYCVVPYVRGKERSRKVAAIVEEIKGLVARGITDVTLLGQNVNSYMGAGSELGHVQPPRFIGQPLSSTAGVERGLGQPLSSTAGVESSRLSNFTELLGLVNEIDGIEKIRFMTSHPKDATSELFKAIRDLDNVVKHLHLPLQSGSDRILMLMNRGYTKRRYLDLVLQARDIIPGLRLTTDVIVGFPGETEEDFNDTLNLMMKEIKFDLAYIFKYSPRPGTKAAELADDVPLDIKKKRHGILLELQKRFVRDASNLRGF